MAHSQQEYPQFLYENVMSKISSRDGEDFKRPSSVSGSIPSINVSGSQDNNTTNRSTHGGSDTSATAVVLHNQITILDLNNLENSGGLTGIFN